MTTTRGRYARPQHPVRKGLVYGLLFGTALVIVGAVAVRILTWVTHRAVAP